MDTLLSILGGVVSGGATGLLGVLLQRFFDYKKQQLDLQIVKLNHENALALAAAETDRARLRADAETRIADRSADAKEHAADQDLAARTVEAESRNLLASFEQDRSTYLEKGAQLGKGWPAKAVLLMMGAVDFARGLLRPALTVHLTVVVTLMFSQMLVLLKLQGHEWTVSELVPIVKLIVTTILYCWTTCVVWWFGTRPGQPQAK
jgi:hypothetical protein